MLQTDTALSTPEDARSASSLQQDTVAEALHLLGVERLVLGIHDPCFPAGSDDVGVGTPYSAAGRELFRYARRLGFNGVQLGPQGDTTPTNPSPYDATLFSRATISVALPPCADEPPASHPERADYADAWPRQRARLLAQFATAPVDEPNAWAAQQGPWLDREARYDALTELFGTDDWRVWPYDANVERSARFVFAQWLWAKQHAQLRTLCGELGLRLWGDLAVGVSHRDVWSMQPLFLSGYRMGAPPSRTTPAGQPWNFPVLDPAQHDAAAGELVEARITKMLDEYDGIRIDHPHGLIDPWVYRTDQIETAADAFAAVRAGARLFSSPDQVDHPRIAAFAVARPDQIDRTRDRWDDLWVKQMEEAQVNRYAVLFDRVIARVKAAGKRVEDQLCEVLSTWPHPLRRVMQRHGLGRLVVTQKAKLDDPGDVYRTENATTADWVMVGNHDTAPVWKVVGEWHGTEAGRARARYLAETLEPDPACRDAYAEILCRSPSHLCTAMFAALFSCEATSVSIFFADFFGMHQSYNVPGTVSKENWSLRLHPEYADHYVRLLATEAGPLALDLPLALRLALHARSIHDGELAERLEALSPHARRWAAELSRS